MNRPDLLAKKIVDVIIPNYNKYYDKGIVIELVKDSILVTYKKNEYTINIKDENNFIMWEIETDNVCISKSIKSSFDDVINTIVKLNK